MNGAAHTLGPWEAVDLVGAPVNDPAVMSPKHCVATVWINDISRKQAGANALLMAAAPDMLAALKQIDEAFSSPEMRALWERAVGLLGSYEGPRANMLAARAAIAKAEGSAS